jgi:uncharacterized damage-inducible protein DinB
MDFKTFEYKIWADKRTLEAIEQIDSSTFKEQFAFVLQQNNHMVIVEELFKSRLLDLQTPHSATNTKATPPFESLKQRLYASGSWYLNFVLSCENINKEIAFVFTDGRQGKMAINEILFHIVNHGTYHRGNIARALDQAGVPHPLDGFGAFIHEFEPHRRKTWQGT